MPRVGFEPTISAGERPKTYALDRAATGTGIFHCIMYEYIKKLVVGPVINKISDSRWRPTLSAITPPNEEEKDA